MDKDINEPGSDSYLATVSIIALAIAIIGIVLLPIAPILSASALMIAIFAKRSSEPNSQPRRAANIVMILATLLLVIEITIIATFLIKTYWPSTDNSKYPALNIKSSK